MTATLHAFAGNISVETIKVNVTLVGDGAMITLQALDPNGDTIAAFTHTVAFFKMDELARYTELVTAKWTLWLHENGFRLEREDQSA
jgi:hypothetical protein